MSKDDSPAPTRIGPYEIRATIAQGRLVDVYAGVLSGPGGFERLRAVAVLRPAYASNAEVVRTFVQHARLLATLEHPNVVRIHEVGEAGAGGTSLAYAAAELLLGESLWSVSRVAKSRFESTQAGQSPRVASPLPSDVVAWIGARVAEGLHQAHELVSATGATLNVVHGNLGPSNVLVTYEGQVKLLGLGHAKVKDVARSLGLEEPERDVAYFAPEQARGEQNIDRRADVFALGAMLWELVAGERLFERGSRTETLEAIAHAEVRNVQMIAGDAPAALWDILRKALARDRDERWTNARDMALELDAFSRSRGRVVTAATVAELMQDLFGGEWERSTKRLQAAGDEPTSPAPLGTAPAAPAPAPPPRSMAPPKPAKRKKKPDDLPNPLREVPTPTWHYLAALAVVAAAVAMTVYASRF